MGLMLVELKIPRNTWSLANRLLLSIRQEPKGRNQDGVGAGAHTYGPGWTGKQVCRDHAITGTAAWCSVACFAGGTAA